MKSTTSQIRSEIKAIIIAKNGNVINADINPITEKYIRLVGIEAVTMVQNALSYFRFSPSQESFRAKYNF